MTGAARTIVLTGATSGLGRALVDRFAAEGHRLVVCGRRADRVAELNGVPGVQASVVDVTKADEVAAWSRSALDAGPVPDLVINNAGVIGEPAPLWEIAAGDFDRVLAVNLSGVANVIRAFVPAMIGAGRGVIANLSSGWGRSTSPEVAPYCATKWGVEGLTQALAQELPDGLAAVAVNPGVIDTDMLRTAWADAASAYEGAAAWSHRAAPFFLALGERDNGRPASVP